MQIARVTINLIRPVPVAELRFAARVIREGKNIQLLDVAVEATDGTLVSRAEVLRVRKEAAPDAENIPACHLAGPAEGVPTYPPTGVGFSRLFEMRAVEGRFETPGPAAVWFMMHGELVAGEATGAVARSLACADFASGIGAAVSFEKWSYPNADLTVAFAREPRTGWVLVDAESWIGPEGRGVVHARLGDADGWFGRSVQDALIIRRSSA